MTLSHMESLVAGHVDENFDAIFMDCDTVNTSRLKAGKAMRILQEKKVSLPVFLASQDSEDCLRPERQNILPRGIDWIQRPIQPETLQRLFDHKIVDSQIAVNTFLSKEPVHALPPKPRQPISTGHIRTASLLRVLVVDDNPFFQTALVNGLKEHGHDVVTASDGVDAVEKIRLRLLDEPEGRNAFDVVFMDCLMPRMDGFEATKAIRELETQRKARRHFVVALTGSTSNAGQEKCFAAGMDDYLFKPVRPDRLAEKLQRALAALPPPPLAPSDSDSGSAPPTVAACPPSSGRPPRSRLRIPSLLSNSPRSSASTSSSGSSTGSGSSGSRSPSTPPSSFSVPPWFFPAPLDADALCPPAASSDSDSASASPESDPKRFFLDLSSNKHQSNVFLNLSPEHIAVLHRYSRGEGRGGPPANEEPATPAFDQPVTRPASFLRMFRPKSKSYMPAN